MFQGCGRAEPGQGWALFNGWIKAEFGGVSPINYPGAPARAGAHWITQGIAGIPETALGTKVATAPPQMELNPSLRTLKPWNLIFWKLDLLKCFAVERLANEYLQISLRGLCCWIPFPALHKPPITWGMVIKHPSVEISSINTSYFKTQTQFGLRGYKNVSAGQVEATEKGKIPAGVGLDRKNRKFPNDGTNILGHFSLNEIPL